MRPTLLALLLSLPLIHCASADFTVADKAALASDAAGAESEAPEAAEADTETAPADSVAPEDVTEADTAPPAPDAVVAPDTAPGPDTAPALDTAPAADTGVPCTHCLGKTGVCPSTSLDLWCWETICAKRSGCYFTAPNVCNCGG